MTMLKRAARKAAGKGRAWLAMLAAVALMAGMMPATALAEEEIADAGEGSGVLTGAHFSVTSSNGEDVGYSYTYSADGTSGLLTIEQTGTYSVSMAPDIAQTSHRIVVAADATVELAGVSIETAGPGVSPIDVSGYDVTLSLTGENAVRNTSSGFGSPGVRKAGPLGRLVVKGPGSLKAVGGLSAAAIGGAFGEDVSGIRIEGGSVTAVAGSDSAAIGSGSGGRAYGLEVAGGIVVAKDGKVGIGSPGSLAQVSISGGTVRAQRGVGMPADMDPGSDSYVRISGGSVEGGSIHPAPVYAPAEGDPVAVNHVVYRVKDGYDPAQGLRPEDLENGGNLPDYYILDGVVPDEEERVHLWHEARVSAAGKNDAGGFEAVFSPSAGTVLEAGASLGANPYTPEPWQVGAVIGTAPGFEGSRLDKVPEVELTSDAALYEPAVLGGQAYSIGDVLERGEGAQTLVVASASPYAPAEGGSPARPAFLNAVDVETGWTSKVTEGADGLAFANPVPYPNVPLKEASGFVKVNGATYALAWEAFAGTPGYDEYSWHYLATLDGQPAGYYHVEKPEGEAAVVSGHFNEGRDPESVGASGDGLTPVEGQVEGADGAAWLALLAGSLDVSLSGASAEEGLLGTLSIRQEATALDRLLGSTGLLGAAEGGNLVLAGGHFAQPGEGPEPAKMVSVVGWDGVPCYTTEHSLRRFSPFVTVALVKAPAVSAKQVQAAAEPGPATPAAKPLAATGDGSAAAAAALAALAVAAAASLALARRRARG